VGEDLFYMVDARFPRSRARLHAFNYDLAESYRRLIHAANAAGVTIYSLGAAGLSPFDSLSAEEGGSREGGSFVIVDSVRKANLETPLHRMSHETGGVALTNSNNTDLFFEQVAQDASAFYSLGYQAADTGSGRYRSVEVKVRRPGAKVRHRSGFRTRSPELRLEQGVMAALALGQAGDGFPGVVTVGRPTQREDGLYAVPLSVKVPLDRVTLVPGEEIWVGRLRFAVQVRDQRGDFSPLNSGEPVDLRIPAGEVEQALGQHITWSVDLLMEAGNHALAVGLADLVADHLDFALGSVTVPSS
jgi:hypothetical protein